MGDVFDMYMKQTNHDLTVNLRRLYKLREIECSIRCQVCGYRTPIAVVAVNVQRTQVVTPQSRVIMRGNNAEVLVTL